MLPDPLCAETGTRVDTPQAWASERRPEILKLFEEHVYGRTPDAEIAQAYDVLDEEYHALGGHAIRRQVSITLSGNGKSSRIELLIYLPVTARTSAAPVFCLLNFGGNHTVHTDPAIALSRSWLRPGMRPAESHRGASASRFPIERIVERGYGVATAYYGDIDPDYDDGFKNGIHPLLDPPRDRSPNAWGAVGAWAYGLSRIMDYMETDGHIDQGRVVLAGHSRLGKTALWAGAQDERFSIVVSNDSGCTGAAISRRKQGETVRAINDQFPHWFCKNYAHYNDREDDLPVDQHMLLALIAPRPLYVASASEDLWADPEGEFKACVHADPVYRLLGVPGIESTEMPEADRPVTKGSIGYHVRSGGHDLTAYDWERTMDFADMHIKTNT